jgi:hypothetical protein
VQQCVPIQPQPQMQYVPMLSQQYMQVPMQAQVPMQYMQVPMQYVQVPYMQQAQVAPVQYVKPQQKRGAPMLLEKNNLTAKMLQGKEKDKQKQMIGEQLYPKIQVVEPRLVGKITGMLLDMDNAELLVLLSDQQALVNKINEALAVLKDHQQKQADKQADK